MKEHIPALWECCAFLARFFEDFSAWLEERPDSSGKRFNGEAANRDALLREYDELFKGVNAGIHIPLWASGEILLDSRTLELVKFYHSWGYEPAGMDGNPPDYIGEQLRFLCCLYAWAFRACEQGDPPGQYAAAARDFTRNYLAATARAVAGGIRRYGVSPLFLEIAESLEDFVRRSGESPDEGVLPAAMGDPLAGEAARPKPWWHGYAAYTEGRRPPIADRPGRFVKTAGRNNCGGKCAVQVREEEGCVTAISAGCGLVGEPFMRACLRGMSYRETFLDSRRLRYPMARVGERGEGRFRRISWEEAADITAAEWVRIRDTYGPASRYVNYSTGVSAALRPDTLVRRLLNLDGGHLGYYNSYSSACTRFVTPYIYGDNYSGNSFEDVLNTKLLILWGHNPRETIFDSERNYYLNKARERGVRIVVIDPRRSDTVRALAAEWIGIRPSTDAALADAMAYVIWSEGLQDQRFMDTFCLGFDEDHLPPGIPPGESYRAYLFGRKDGIPKTPLWAEAITAVPAGAIVRLAREYAGAKPACLLPGLGLQRTGSGEQTVRTLAMLCCLTGNVGKSGGGAAGCGSLPSPPFRGYPVPPNPYPGRIPSFLWTRAVEQGPEMTPQDDGLIGVERLDTDIKLIFNLAGNVLVNQHSDINRTIRLLRDPAKCEFIVCSDIFMTSSARFADILLPASSFLEDENIAPPWESGDYLLFNNKVIDPPFGCRFEYRFVEDIARRLGLWDVWSAGHAGSDEWLETIYGEVRRLVPEFPEYGIFREEGGYHLRETKPYIAYEEQIRDFANHPFSTPSGKVEIFSPRLYALNRPEEVPAIPGYLPCPEGPEDPLTEKYPLQLIGWHTKRRTHSIHDNNRDLERVEPQRLWLHPEDAERRGITEGDLVEVFNDRGRIRLPVRVTADIIPGVAAMPQGAWYTPDSSGTDTRGSFNVLSSQRPTPLARGNPQHTNLVEVQKAGVPA